MAARPWRSCSPWPRGWARGFGPRRPRLLPPSLSTPPPAPSASSASSTTAEGVRADSSHVATFALIVANNRSLALTQPDLQYADDDGARYYRLFRSTTEASNIALLTTFDRRTEEAYSELAGLTRRPSLPELEAAIGRLAEAVGSARARGERTEFYFVFAGHGDIEEGRGYVELEDSRIDGAFIEHKILERIQADSKHILLDSCNSFFVINPRKPGGRRWATPKDMALGFSARHPEVGLFLSTNSDSEVFEWSEIESGVFSHEIRSGLSGAADVNGDGVVSYSELAGFVERANAGIASESLRPHLFARGPDGNAGAAFFHTSRMAGRRITLDAAQTRLWVKGQRGDRLLDVHKEPGPMTVVLPGTSQEELGISIERKPAEASGRPTVFEHVVPAGQAPVVVAALNGKAPSTTARGGRLFGSIFAQPYGPLAYAQYVQRSVDAPEPVYGLTDEDLSRAHNYLEAMAGLDRTTRSGTGYGLIAVGALTIGAAVGFALDSEDRARYPAVLGATAGFGLLFVGGGLYSLLTPSTGERALQTFDAEVAGGQGNRALAFVKTEQFLTEMAERERRSRTNGFWLMEGVGLGMAGLGTLLVLDPPPESSNRNIMLSPAVFYTYSAILIAGGFLVRSIETPTERFLKLYHDDPGLKLRVGPVAMPGGGGLSVTGRF